MSANLSGEDLLRLFVENVPQYAILVMDTAGRVAYWNRGATAVLGYDRGEVLGKPVTMIFTPEDVATGIPENELTTAIRTGEAADERWHVRKDGSRFWAQGILVSVKDEAGTLQGFGKILRDRTDLKELQDELSSHAQALEQANEQKNLFLATVSHELRNPLAPLANCVQLLRSGSQSTPAIADMMARQITQLRRLVDDLVDVTRISRGKLELRKTRVDLVRVVQQSAESVRGSIEARQHEMKISVPAHAAEVEGDAGRLDQVITNLLDNAIKYTEPGGEIALELTAEDAEAVLHVRDTGIGIAEQYMEHIFGLFTQAHPELEQSKRGLGLGLALVKDLVRLHRGTVRAHSAGPGKGSEFIVRLPLLNPQRRDIVLGR